MHDGSLSEAFFIPYLAGKRYFREDYLPEADISRLVGSVLIEQAEKWSVRCSRYSLWKR